MATKEEVVAVPSAAAAGSEAATIQRDHSGYSITDRRDSSLSSDHDDLDLHRSLHRFMLTLLHDAAVTGLKTILIQDNASILCKTASRSARAAHQRLALGGRDHMIITKEISRWESYPFEVNKPIAANNNNNHKPKRNKNKNGAAVPQRRARRRSGLESAGEIKADIIKKAESLPRRPRRRSSVVTDDAKKNTMQHELLSLFLYDDDSSDSEGENSDTNNSTKSDKSASRPKRETSPLRNGMLPKKPIRRVSVVPPENNNSNTGPYSSNNNRLPTKSTMLSDFIGDSQHSNTSTETTLSEIVSRQSDLSSICEQTTEFQSTLDENRLMDCCAILEEEEEQHLVSPLNLKNQDAAKVPPGAQTNGNGNNKRQGLSPRKPVRRVSESPETTTAFVDRNGPTENALGTDEQVLPSLSLIDSASSIDPDGSFSAPFDEDDNDNDNDTGNSLSKSDNPTPTRRGIIDERMVNRSVSMPSNNPTPTGRGIIDERIMNRSASMPRKPTRRVSGVPQDLVSAAISSGGSDCCRQNETHLSYSTESTASETTSDGSTTTADETAGGVFLQQSPIVQSTETTQSLDCAVIPEENDDDDQ